MLADEDILPHSTDLRKCCVNLDIANNYLRICGLQRRSSCKSK